MLAATVTVSEVVLAYHPGMLQTDTDNDRYPRYKSADYCPCCGLSFSHWPGCPETPDQ